MANNATGIDGCRVHDHGRFLKLWVRGQDSHPIDVEDVKRLIRDLQAFVEKAEREKR